MRSLSQEWSLIIADPYRHDDRFDILLDLNLSAKDDHMLRPIVSGMISSLRVRYNSTLNEDYLRTIVAFCSVADCDTGNISFYHNVVYARSGKLTENERTIFLEAFLEDNTPESDAILLRFVDHMGEAIPTIYHDKALYNSLGDADRERVALANEVACRKTLFNRQVVLNRLGLSDFHTLCSNPYE